MSLVPSLLRAIVLVDGESLVLHAGDKPYVQTATDQFVLSAAELTSSAIAGVLDDLLPAESQRLLAETGAIRHAIADIPELPGEQFHLVAAKAGDDLWTEIRRREPEPAQPARNDTTVAPEAARPAAPGAARPMPYATELESLLQLAFGDGASALVLSGGDVPWIRVDGEMRRLEHEPPLGPVDVVSILGAAGVPASGPVPDLPDWTIDLPEFGPIRCTAFHDHRGPGVILKVLALRPMTAARLGFTREIEALSALDDGLVIVTGRRAGAARAVIGALVGVINRTRNAHVITIEREVTAVHERGGSFISQRAVGRSLDAVLAAASAAVREEPDVLVIEHADSDALMRLAFDAAASRRLILCGCRAAAPADAADTLLDLFSAGDRASAQVSLARHLRAVVGESVNGSGEGGRPRLEVLSNTGAPRR